MGILRRFLRGTPEPVNKADFKGQYRSMVKALTELHQGNTDRAMELAVGGQFEAVGALEMDALRHFGLAPEHYLIDVGCGSGRLAKPLSTYLKGRYLGIDIVPSLVSHARRITGRDDWRFEVAEGLTIPETDGAADMVCFFSVFTHLLHEQSYVYLREAKRVLKPGGTIVFTFLDFTVKAHWASFEASIADLGPNHNPLNVFMSRAAIRVWADRLGLSVQALVDGERRFIPLARPVKFEGGGVLEKVGNMGQSICVLRTPGA